MPIRRVPFWAKEYTVRFDCKSLSLAAAALTAALAAPARAEPAQVPQYPVEKCYGIAAAAKNDCQTLAHACAGEAKQARDKESWIYVPAGTCTKIDGGSLKSS
jgi:uncharacterized membrane protein